MYPCINENYIHFRFHFHRCKNQIPWLFLVQVHWLCSDSRSTFHIYLGRQELIGRDRPRQAINLLILGLLVTTGVIVITNPNNVCILGISLKSTMHLLHLSEINLWVGWRDFDFQDKGLVLNNIFQVIKVAETYGQILSNISLNLKCDFSELKSLILNHQSGWGCWWKRLFQINHIEGGFFPNRFVPTLNMPIDLILAIEMGRALPSI